MTKDDITDISMAAGNWDKIRAFVTVKFTNGLTLNGVRVVLGRKGLFAAMPNVRKKNKESGEMEWKDCCWLEEDEDKKAFQNIILEAYNAKVGESRDSEGASGNDGSSFF